MESTMTFTNFLQVLAFNLLSNTIPLCLLLYVTAYLIAKMFEKKLNKIFQKEYELLKKDVVKGVN